MSRQAVQQILVFADRGWITEAQAVAALRRLGL